MVTPIPTYTVLDHAKDAGSTSDFAALYKANTNTELTEPLLTQLHATYVIA